MIIHEDQYPNIVVVIPAFNEARFIGSTVLQTINHGDNIIVVDDGSVDDTVEIAELAGAIVIKHKTNQGKGAALKTGLQAAYELNPQCVVVLDADGQHAPQEMARIVDPIYRNHADIVVGSRYLENNSTTPRHRIWGHQFFNWMNYGSSGVKLTDSQSGFRAFSPEALRVMSFNSHGFSVESEMQFIAREHALRVVEVPVTIHYHDKPKRSVWMHGLQVLNGVLRLVGQYRPLLFFGVPGTFVLFIGLLVGLWVFRIYQKTEMLALGYALISVLLIVIGALAQFSGVILHSVRGLLLEILNQPEEIINETEILIPGENVK